KLGDIKVHEVGVMKNNRLDRALHLIALMTVRGDNVHDFAGNAVLVGPRDATEWMPHLLSEFSLHRFSSLVLIELQRLAYVSQECTGDEIIALNRDAAAKRTLQHICDGDALESAGIKVFDELHVDVAGQQGEFDRAQFGEGPAFPAAAGDNRFVP